MSSFSDRSVVEARGVMHASQTGETEQIKTRIYQALEGNPLLRGRAKTLQVELSGNTVVVSGCLPSFYLKQQLQETIRHVDGVQRLVNSVQVV